MKSAIAIIFLILYCAWVNVYIYNWDAWDKWHSKVYSLFATIIFLTWLAIADKIGETAYLCSQVILISRITIILNFLLILLYTLQIIVNYESLAYLLNGSILVTSLSILISGSRHGALKD